MSVTVQVQRGIGQFGGVCVHHGAGGASLQQPLPRGQQRDAAVVHVQPPGSRATTWGGEFSAAAPGLICVLKRSAFTFSVCNVLTVCDEPGQAHGHPFIFAHAG